MPHLGAYTTVGLRIVSSRVASRDSRLATAPVSHRIVEPVSIHHQLGWPLMGSNHPSAWSAIDHEQSRNYCIRHCTVRKSNNLFLDMAHFSNLTRDIDRFEQAESVLRARSSDQRRSRIHDGKCILQIHFFFQRHLLAMIYPALRRPIDLVPDIGGWSSPPACSTTIHLDAPLARLCQHKW